MSYGVVRTDNMYATDVRGGGLVSIKYIVTENAGQDNETKTETAIENGCVLKIGDLKNAEAPVGVHMQFALRALSRNFGRGKGKRESAQKHKTQSDAKDLF